jgi:hypothetical protein
MRATSETSSCPQCAICGTTDARVLVMTELSGAAVTLCGSHAVMLSRLKEPCRSVEDLRALLADRRTTDRRATGEVDELAARLSAAFVRERRTSDRRADEG